jgi:hypothetical protein
MRAAAIMAIILASIVSILLVEARAQALLNPEIANRAKLAVKELDIKPESNLRWGENKLGGGLLRPGQTISINEFTEANCKYQMRAVFQDGRTEERRPVDICRHSRMVLGEHQQ